MMCYLKESDGYHPSHPCPKCNPTGGNNMAYLVFVGEDDGLTHVKCTDCRYEEIEK